MEHCSAHQVSTHVAWYLRRALKKPPTEARPHLADAGSAEDVMLMLIVMSLQGVWGGCHSELDMSMASLFTTQLFRSQRVCMDYRCNTAAISWLRGHMQT